MSHPRCALFLPFARVCQSFSPGAALLCAPKSLPPGGKVAKISDFCRMRNAGRNRKQHPSFRLPPVFLLSPFLSRPFGAPSPRERAMPTLQFSILNSPLPLCPKNKKRKNKKIYIDHRRRTKRKRRSDNVYEMYIVFCFLFFVFVTVTVTVTVTVAVTVICSWHLVQNKAMQNSARGCICIIKLPLRRSYPVTTVQTFYRLLHHPCSSAYRWHTAASGRCCDTAGHRCPAAFG